MIKKAFLDTSFVIALISVSDKNHQRAVKISEEIKSNNTSLTTSMAVVFEIGNSLSKLQYRKQASTLLSALETDEQINVMPVNQNLFQKALNLFVDREDKEWSLTDCVSFIIMKELKINYALTNDKHFVQAGFDILL